MIKVGNVLIGGKFIPIQSMIKNSITDIDTTIKKINNLAIIGCDIIRVAIPDIHAVNALKTILNESKLPVVADIHFDHRLAVKVADMGVHKIRLNPGNITEEKKIKEVITALKRNNIPVRIGINCGSLPKHLLNKYNNDKIKVMIESAKEEIGYFEKYGFDKIVLSFKSSNVLETINVNRLAKKSFSFPIHIGVTEAGDYIDGAVKNAAGLSVLLLEGIGDTIRVSLTANEEKEVRIAKKILESIEKRESKYEIISCPTCGRTEVNIENIVTEIKRNIPENIKFKQKIKIAVMGCVVNGPGEAENSDFGVACGKDKSLIFKNGKKIKVINNASILDELLIMIGEYYE